MYTLVLHFFCFFLIIWSNHLTAQEQIIQLDTVLLEQINIDTVNARYVDAIQKKQMEEALQISDTIIAYNLYKWGERSLPFNDALFLKADVYTKMSQWKSAQKSYEYILQMLDPHIYEDSVFLSKIHFYRGLNFYNQSQYLDAIDAYNSSLDLRLILLDYYTAEIGSCYHNLGSCNLSLGEFDKAIEHYLKAIDIRKKVYGENHPEVAHPFQNLANCYLSKRNYNVALDYYKKALAIRIPVFGENHQDVASNYNMLGICYYYLGDGYLARYYLEKSLNIRIGLFGANSPNIVTSYINLGGICIQSLEVNKARHYYLKALDIQKQIDGTAKERLYQIYSSLGASYFQDKDYTNALHYYTLSSQMAKELGVNEDILDETYENIGTIHMNLSEFTSAIEYYKKAESIFIKKHGEKNKHLPMLYLYMAKSYQALNQIDSMQYYILNATEQLEMGVVEKASFHSYCYQILGGIYILDKNYYKAFEAYENSLKTLGNIDSTAFNSENHVRQLNGLAKLNSIHYSLYKIDREPHHKEKSLTYAIDCISQINHFKKKLSDQDLLKFIDQFYFVYSNFLDLYTEGLDDSELKTKSSFLFGIAEENRSNEILVEFIKNTSLDDSAFPEESQQRLKELRHEIIYLEKTLEAFDSSSEVDSTYVRTQSRLFDLKVRQDSLEKQLLNDTPNTISKEPEWIVELDKVKHCLEQNQCILTYAVLDKKVLVQIINNENDFIQTLPLPDNFLEIISLYKSSLNSYYLSEEKTDSLYRSSLDNYIKTSTSLYNMLIKPIEHLLHNRITVIPDATLTNIPFGALLSYEPTKPSNFNTFPFLERKFKFSYGFSVSMFCHMKNKTPYSSPQNKVLAFAPFYKKISTDKTLTNIEKRNQYLDKDIVLRSKIFKDSLTPLPHSYNEVKEIAKIMPSDLFVGEEATTSAFLENYNNYKVIHLSTHGKANPEQVNLATLAFYPEAHDSGLLFSRNIYKLKNKASVVVLSGCETAGGHIIKGEGALSLTRAFVLSGSKSVLASLWLVDDQTTKDFMVNFYSGLKLNKPIDQSIHDAKLKILSQKNNTIKHPFFWSAYSCYGDTTLQLVFN